MALADSWYCHPALILGNSSSHATRTGLLLIVNLAVTLANA
jgi:hypothetical protein